MTPGELWRGARGVTESILVLCGFLKLPRAHWKESCHFLNFFFRQKIFPFQLWKQLHRPEQKVFAVKRHTGLARLSWSFFFFSLPEFSREERSRHQMAGERPRAPTVLLDFFWHAPLPWGLDSGWCWVMLGAASPVPPFPGFTLRQGLSAWASPTAKGGPEPCESGNTGDDKAAFETASGSPFSSPLPLPQKQRTDTAAGVFPVSLWRLWSGSLREMSFL